MENKVDTFGPSGPVSGAARASGLQLNSYKQTLLLLLHNFITSSLTDISVLVSHCWAEVCTLQSADLASNVYLSTCAAP